MSARLTLRIEAGSGQFEWDPVELSISKRLGENRYKLLRETTLDLRQPIELPEDEQGKRRPGDKLEQILASLTAREGIPYITQPELLGLGDTLLGLVGSFDLDDECEEIWIETESPLIAGLPWPLARNDRSDSLLKCGYTVVLDVSGRVMGKRSAGLPNRPRVLLVMPNAPAYAATPWESHSKELQAILGVGSSCELRVLEPATAQALIDALQQWQPQIVYYFGHGELNPQGVLSLVMTDGPLQAHRLARAIEALGGMTSRPQLLYLNCCWGAVSSRLGGPLQLARLVPVMISNRASADIEAARRQAAEVMRRIVVRGEPPHQAVMQTMQELRSLGRWARGLSDSQTDPAWLMPAVFGNFDEWRSQPGRPSGDAAFTFDDTVALDRGDQLARLRVFIGTKAIAPPPPAVAFLWCGTGADGLDTLVRQLRADLESDETLRLRQVSDQQVAWPVYAGGTPNPAERKRLLLIQLAEVLLEEAGASSEKIAAVIAGAFGRTNRARIALLLQAAIKPDAEVDVASNLVESWLSVLQDLAVKRVLASPVTLAGFLPIEVPADSAVAKAVATICNDKSWHGVRPVLLPALGPVSVADIATFLQRAGRGDQYLDGAVDRVAASIHSETRGVFEPTRRELTGYTKHLFADGS